jgi:hypothetical protein
MRLKYILGGVAAFFLSMVLGMVTYYYIHPLLPREMAMYDSKKEIDEEAEGKEAANPFEGWKDKPRKRAWAVVIDNEEEARPQAGLERADVVVELPIEGGVTRFIAIIPREDLDLVGPVRSVRPHFVELAGEYKAILVHAGGSEEALQKIAEEKPDHLDEIYGGYQVAAAFWRTPDQSKPHNLFTSSDTLRRVAKQLKMNVTSLPPQRPLLSQDVEVPGEEVEDLHIFYPHKSCMVRFVYNKEKKVFERFISDENKPHLNAAGEQLTAANVLIQFISSQYKNGDGHLQIITQGEGEALIFRAGKVIKGRWEKTPGNLTKFTDEKGAMVALLEGPTWIEIVPQGSRVDY